MKKQTQHGKDLSGLFSGLLLATAVIIGILFFLNKENRGGFKKVKLAKEVSETEVLQPKGNRTKPKQEEESEIVPDRNDVTGDESEPETDKKTPLQTATKQAEPEIMPEVDGGTSEPIVTEPKIKAKPQHQIGEVAGSEAVTREASSAKPETDKTVEPKTETEKKTAGLTDKQRARIECKLAEKKAAGKRAAEHKAVTKKDSGQKESKPTPEQILSGDSVEKARTEHKVAQTKEETKKAVSGSNSAKVSSGGREVVSQMGSYIDRKSAGTQRAKSAIIGIFSSVVEGAANDKDVYRVQSAAMAQDDTKNTQQTLQKHGVSSFARSVKQGFPMKLKTALVGIAPSALLPASTQAAVEGKDYTILPRPAPQQQADKIEVLEFFGHFCVHCYYLDPVLLSHSETFAKDTYLRTKRVMWQPGMLGLARAAVAVDGSGLKRQANSAISQAVCEQKISLANSVTFRQWAQARKSFDGKKLVTTYDSPTSLN